MIMLIAIAAVDLVGLGISLEKAVSDDPSTVRASVQVTLPERFPPGSASPVVVSRDREIIVSKVLSSEGQAFLGLRPGTYRFSIHAGEICSRIVEVTSQPLQVVSLDCSM